MDVGQSTAIGLYQQAAAGTFHMEEGAARKCAEIYQRFAESLDKLLTSSHDLQRLNGFGSFNSALKLQEGFEGKAVKLTEAIAGLQEAALRMAAAYLRAGNLVDEADTMNQQAIAAASTGQAQ